ncbi:acyl-CoA thioesterase [Sphingomonas bacterium]|uniref:acyl-CoA thioesterase n=1 Tax=Sphingomonas bacterium TaxID=1895847 RepID=UPI0015752176|nr:acyl-CoA thioesterase domain-containing protein [Sphingomonas bacterium]
MTDVLTASELLALEPVGPDLLRSIRNQDNRAGIIFGGQPLCQALAAARATVPEWRAHNLSAVFLRPGNVAEPVDYAVERLRDGRHFAVRRVLARQSGRPIFDLLCSFHDPEDGEIHQRDGIAGVPLPEAAIGLGDFVAVNADRLPLSLVEAVQRGFPVELRLIDPDAAFFGASQDRARDFWFRMPSAQVIADPLAHECLLAFASDYWLAGTASIGQRGDAAVASLNHNLWFHAPVDVGDWLLHRTDSPWAGAGRGLARGLIFDRGGRLVASSAQEISLRRR